MRQLTRLRTWTGRHRAILAVVAVAAPLVLTNLGDLHLWSDEGDTAVLARSVLTHGVPRAWDGITFSDSDLGARLSDDLVMVSHPWLQYYVTAASFAVFGESALAARLPFALLGVATLALLHALVLVFTRSQRAAVTASLLLLLSVQFLIYARQSRHYALSAFLTCLLLLLFHRMRTWKGCLAFAAVAVLLFHAHPIGLVPVGVLAGLSVVFRPFAPQRPWIGRSLPLVLALTLPWFLLATGGYAENATAVRSVEQFLGRLAQFGVETASVTPLVGILLLAIGLAILRKRRLASIVNIRNGEATADAVGELSLMVISVALLGAYAVAMAITQSRDELWMTGVRHAPAVLPITMALAGVLIARASRGDRRVWLGLVLVFGFTGLARIAPWTLGSTPTATRPAAAFAAVHRPAHLLGGFLNTAQPAFVASLFETPRLGTTGQVAEYLNTHAAPGDIVVTNYGWEPLYFHTRLPQGMKVLPSYPIYAAARRQGLPEYVFTGEGVRWIIWRRAWGPYRGHDCDRLVRTLTDRGLSVQLVATIEETVWENRENVHFHRFGDAGYLYPWFSNLPDAVIYRVG